jgi:hypothetical protein
METSKSLSQENRCSDRYSNQAPAKWKKSYRFAQLARYIPLQQKWKILNKTHEGAKNKLRIFSSEIRRTNSYQLLELAEDIYGYIEVQGGKT